MKIEIQYHSAIFILFCNIPSHAQNQESPETWKSYSCDSMRHMHNLHGIIECTCGPISLAAANWAAAATTSAVPPSPKKTSVQEVCGDRAYIQ